MENSWKQKESRGSQDKNRGFSAYGEAQKYED